MTISSLQYLDTTFTGLCFVIIALDYIAKPSFIYICEISSDTCLMVIPYMVESLLSTIYSYIYSIP